MEIIGFVPKYSELHLYNWMVVDFTRPFPLLDPTPGSKRWIQALAPTPGSNHWRQPLTRTTDTNPWFQTMG